MKWCERGKGLKPDWAAKGIEFLCFAADPKVTNFLSDDEFMVLYLRIVVMSRQSVKGFQSRNRRLPQSCCGGQRNTREKAVCFS